MALNDPIDALRYAERAHGTQLDRSGLPYFGHIERVVANTSRLLERIPAKRMSVWRANDIIQAAALHDTTEDTSVTFDQLLRDGFDPEVVRMVRRLDGRAPGVSYQENIQMIADEDDIGVIVIKLADNMDNGDPRRIASMPPEQRSIERRYARARVVLEAAYNAYLEAA